MLKELSNEIYTPPVVAINRFVEMAIVFFNTLVALMLLTSPWYIVDVDAAFTQVSNTCVVPAGTAIAPFVSKPCGVAFTDITEGGKAWRDMHMFVWVFFGLSLLTSAVIGYEVVKHGVREWNDANTMGFAIQLGLIIIQGIIIGKSGDLVKPVNVEASTADILLLVAISLSGLRILALGLFMFVTKKYAPRGYFGTGAYA